MLVYELRIGLNGEVKADPGLRDLIGRLVFRWRLQYVGHHLSGQFTHGFPVHRSSLRFHALFQLACWPVHRSIGSQVLEHGFNHLEIHDISTDSAQYLVSLWSPVQSARP